MSKKKNIFFIGMGVYRDKTKSLNMVVINKTIGSDLNS